MYETINSPVTLGGLTLKNRIIFAPTSMGLKEDELLVKMEAIAAGDCAMIIIGDVPVGKRGFHSLFTRKGAAYYRRLTAAAHEHGCLICAQLHQSDSDWKGMLRFLPDILTKRISHEELRRLLNDQISHYLTALLRKKSAESPPPSVPPPWKPKSLALIWSRSMATGCAAASAPPSTTNARIPTAVHLKTGRALQWNAFPPSAVHSPNFP